MIGMVGKAAVICCQADPSVPRPRRGGPDATMAITEGRPSAEPP